MFRSFIELFTNNILTKLVSVIIAVILWLVVLGSHKIEITKEIPLEISTAPNTVIANEIPSTITVTLSVPKAFSRAILNRNEPAIPVNLQAEPTGSVSYRFKEIKNVPVAARVVSIRPNRIKFELEKVSFRKIPIRAELIGNPPEGFEVGGVQVIPDKVKFKGSNAKLRNITEILTYPIDVSELTASAEVPVKLDIASLGVTLDSPAPTIRIDIKAQKAPFKIRNVNVRVQNSRHRYRLLDKTVTIFVRAMPNDLKNLDHRKIFAEVNLASREKGTFKEPVRVILPKNIDLVQVVPDKVGIQLY